MHSEYITLTNQSVIAKPKTRIFYLQIYSITEQWKAEVLKNRKELLWCMDKKYKLDESKRPVNNNNDGLMMGSFRKLAVD